jgi:hypothetical protein
VVALRCRLLEALMGRRKNRRHGWRKWLNPEPVIQALAPVGAAVMVRPLRAALFALAGLTLAVFVIRSSLPYALVPGNTGLALFFGPGNPAALLAEAEQRRIEWLALVTAEVADSQARQQGRPSPDPRMNAARTERRDALRNEIRARAQEILAHEPLNARAFRLLAETADSTDEVRELMLAAVQRSRRESAALFWLLNDNYVRQDFREVVKQVDILLRTRPQLAQYVYAYLTETADSPEGLPLVVQLLSESPPWRYGFFRNLPEVARRADLPLDIMVALLSTPRPPTDAEIAPYLIFLIRTQRIDVAYNAWLRLLPKDQLDSLGFLTNPGFERDPSGLPFDWTFERGQNARVELVSSPTQEGRRVLHASLGAGRIRFPEVKQLLILPAGRFRIEGKTRGSLTGRRGLRWQARCAGNLAKVLGETDLIIGQINQWRMFQLEFVHPNDETCRAVELRLFFDARSASEEYLAGEIFFDDLQIERRSN